MTHDQLITASKELLKSKSTGRDFIEQTIPIVCELAKLQKGLAEEQKTELAPLVALEKEVRAKYKKPVAEIDAVIGTKGTLREAIADRAQGMSEAVSVPGVGMVSFSEKWEYTIEDEAKLPKDYKVTVPDEKKIAGMISAGIRDIKGVKIYPKTIIQIRPA